MTKLLLVITLVCVSICSKAQSYCAIVDDKDGYANIRDNENNVIDKVLNGTLIFSYGEEKNGWEYIDYERAGTINTGSIHRTRLKPISEFRNIPILQEDTNPVILSDNQIKIQVKKQPFNTQNHQVAYAKDGSTIWIDDKKAWGIDGYLPTEEYQAISITIKGQKVMMPYSTYSDLYNPNLDMTRAYLDSIENKLYITSVNSDGAGGYFVIWLFENGIYKDRLVTHGF